MGDFDCIYVMKIIEIEYPRFKKIQNQICYTKTFKTVKVTNIPQFRVVYFCPFLVHKYVDNL
jgi:hypothetical protein